MRRTASVLVLCVSGACASPAVRPADATRAARPDPPQVTSNLFRGDYAGSGECRFCHAAVYDAWKESPMHRMTRRAGGADIRAPFDGATFHLGRESVTMEQHDGQRFMRVASTEAGVRLYRITKVIGGRTREDYAGIDVTAAKDPASDRGRGVEMVLPVTYVYGAGAWRYKGYSVMASERPHIAVGPAWAQTCIGCHNTLPYASLLLDDLFGEGAPSYQGTSGAALPPPRRPRPVVVDEAGLRQAVADEITYVGGAPPDPHGASLRHMLASGMHAMREKLAGRHLVEVGIGCEACHGGAREHVDDPKVRPTFEAQSPVLRIDPPSGRQPTRAQAVNRTCARCHAVLFSQYPFTWEGGQRDDPVPGGSSMNSGEARDFLLGACSDQLSCVACHDPHTRDAPERLREIATVRGNAVCLACHPAYAGEAALVAHTHHEAQGEGSACVACHMPRKNMGLDYELTRYHRIGSPTDDERVTRDRPLECALCHADRSVQDLVGSMERWWGRRYDRAALRALYGDDLGVNVLWATLTRGKPHERGAAIGVLGEQRAARAVPWLAPLLAHDIPLVRFFAKHAIERIIGSPLAIDPNEPAAALRVEAARWVADYRPRSPSP